MVPSPILTWVKLGIKELGDNGKGEAGDFSPGEKRMLEVDAREQVGTLAVQMDMLRAQKEEFFVLGGGWRGRCFFVEWDVGLGSPQVLWRSDASKMLICWDWRGPWTQRLLVPVQNGTVSNTPRELSLPFGDLSRRLSGLLMTPWQ